MSEVPIACSLSQGELADRVDEWQEFFALHVDAAHHEDNVLRLRLRDGDRDGDDVALLAAVSLAAREKACCPFFSFAVDVEVTERWLRVTVPDGAGEVLDEFAGLLPATLRQ